MRHFLLLNSIFLLLVNQSLKSQLPPKTEPYADLNTTVLANDTCKMIDNYLLQIAGDKHFSGGLLIIKDGKKIFSKGYGWADKDRMIPFTPRTLALMGSITKLFTATAIIKLQEEGKLSLDDSLSKYFPSIPIDKAGITIKQLLTHASGFHEFLRDDQGDYEKLQKQAFLERAFAEPLAFKPGTKAVYTNVGMSMLAVIIEQISGTDYESFLKKALFKPYQIDIGYHYPTSTQDTIAHGYQNGQDWGTHQTHFKAAGGGPYWNLKGNGGLEASLNDMYQWANAFTNQTILNQANIQKMFAPQIEEDGTAGRSFFGYGCNITMSRRKTKMIENGGSNGIYFARLLRLPDEGVVFYMVTNETNMNTNMVLPNITQLYFNGAISQDATVNHRKLETQMANTIYKIITETSPSDLGQELKKNKIVVEDDMVLLDVGQMLLEEGKATQALILYQYYTNLFPQIVVAWNDMGDVYRMLNNKEESIKCYKMALQLRPENNRAKTNLEKLNK